MMLWMIFGLVAYAQAPSGSPQQPRYQPGWPCTGKERAFDPAYLKVAEATGGHLFLFDKSEVAGTSALAIGDRKHGDTIFRASGKLESYVDIRIPVDASVDSLFLVASLQCMQTIQLYDPQRTNVNADQILGGEDHWFRAGRIATVPHPVAGEWLVRLAGTGAYSVSVQAHAQQGMRGIQMSGIEEKTLSLRLTGAIANPQFRLIGPAGEALQTITLQTDPDSPGRYSGTFQPASPQFRLLVEDGAGFERVDPRLFDAKPVQ